MWMNIGLCKSLNRYESEFCNGHVQCLQSATLIDTLSHCGSHIGLFKNLNRYISLKWASSVPSVCYFDIYS